MCRNIFCFLVALLSPALYAAEQTKAAERQAFFGDLHIHTMYSFDAFLSSVRTTPDDAYNYAKGEPIDHPAGTKIRLGGPPLDFLMVADHAIFLGVFAAQLDPRSPIADHPETGTIMPNPTTPLSELAQRLRRLQGEGHEFFGPKVSSYAWQKNVEAAERHNNPGKFTAFIGYEYTPTPGGRHLHRNVVFRDSKVPERPFSAADSGDPEDLWRWLDGLRLNGIEALAIPHNMNQSDGLAFQRTTFNGAPISREFAELRMRNEPIAEISQQKGTSETHPSLSPNDEWAGFQIVQYYLNRTENKDPISVFKGGYYRDALKTGVAMQARDGFNPYQLGAIGSSDSHLSAGAYAEDARFSSRDNTPQSRGSAPTAGPDSSTEPSTEPWANFWTPRQATHGTGGLAGVWSEENTRASLYDAMRRKETFATSGPRIRVRLFGSFDLPKNILSLPNPVSAGYAHGVPMGGVLHGNARQVAGNNLLSPSLFVWAARDPHTAWLQRIQIVKGWVENGQPTEAVFDVACSDGLTPDKDTHRCPDNGAAVNVDDCSISRDTGAVELATVWQDPDFDPQQQAFYYARVLENPTCRWSTWDAVNLGIAPNPDLPPIHQERAWSSPIWYQPQL